jgi:hypothetical protein
MFIGDTETGRRIVRQEPNLASGGRATETDLQEFLNRTGSSPENLVLQELLERAKSDREFLPLLPFSLELGIHFAGRPRPDQVSPVAGLRYLAAGPAPVVEPFAPPRPTRSASEIPRLAALDFTSSRKLALAPAISAFLRSVAILINSSRSLAVRLSISISSLAADVRGATAALRLTGTGAFRAAFLRGRPRTAFAILPTTHCFETVKDIGPKRADYKDATVQKTSNTDFR